MQTVALIFATLLAIVSKTAAVTCAEAAATCSFYFTGYADSVPTYDICGTPDNGPGFTDAIALRSGASLLSVNSNVTDKWLAFDGTFKLMSRLDKQLTPTQFKPFNEWDGTATVSKIGHETFQGTSELSAGGECYKVQFNQYAYVLDGNTFNVNLGKAKDCIVFETLTCGGGERKLAAAAGHLRGTRA